MEMSLLGSTTLEQLAIWLIINYNQFKRKISKNK